MSEDLKAAARRWAYEYMLCNFEIPEHAQDDEYMAAKYITQCLAPPTMEGLPWDYGRHYLAGATDGEHECIMISPYRHDEESPLEIAAVTSDSSNILLLDPSDLTPNGKKYELREVTVSPDEEVAPEQRDHTDVLRTKDDYFDAPFGSVVAVAGSFPWIKTLSAGWMRCGSGDVATNFEMAGAGRKVLRWGWGE